MLRYEPKITQLSKGWFGFQFKCKDDSKKILGEVWNYGVTPFKLKKWTPLFDADTEKMDIIPVWVQLLGFPWEFWNPTSLRDIAKALGTFIEAYLSFLKTK